LLAFGALFFFHAGDGIRYFHVTGVQTCALPIFPGALNRPNSLNMQEGGRFKPAEQLREEFQALLGSRQPGQIVHQCGSGITASHNLFAMELAGLHGSALYPGSWSEWCSDAKRPVETGG